MRAVQIRQATAADFATVADMYDQATAWLASRGLDQWQPIDGDHAALRKRMHHRIADSIKDGDCHLALLDSQPAATITVDEHADPEFWQPEDQPEDALYVHRMIVVRRAAGQGLGSQLLAWASQLAARRGKRWLRLDAWSRNPGLHDYYRRQGFDHVRTLKYSHRGSGALFQIDVSQAFPKAL